MLKVENESQVLYYSLDGMGLRALVLQSLGIIA